MAELIIALCSQKGGVGKSTLARLVAREYAQAKWSIKIADLDISQGTSFNWQSRRLQHGIEPVIAVERFGTVEQALKVAPHVDLLGFRKVVTVSVERVSEPPLETWDTFLLGTIQVKLRSREGG
jgi:cellulose biosynthesis protein BcsQ